MIVNGGVALFLETTGGIIWHVMDEIVENDREEQLDEKEAADRHLWAAEGGGGGGRRYVTDDPCGNAKRESPWKRKRRWRRNSNLGQSLACTFGCTNPRALLPKRVHIRVFTLSAGILGRGIGRLRS